MVKIGKKLTEKSVVWYTDVVDSEIIGKGVIPRAKTITRVMHFIRR